MSANGVSESIGNKARRNYGIDLLKALSMIMVVAHHIIMASGVETAYEGWSDWLVQSVHSFCYGAVDCFVMATGFIMCRKSWKWQRVMSIWLQVVGYSLVLTAIGLVVLPPGEIVWRTWLKAVFPICNNQYWFVTQYVVLFFAIPYLNLLVDQMSARQFRNLVLGGGVILSVVPVIAGSDLFVLRWGYSFTWFIYLYLAGALLRSHGPLLTKLCGVTGAVVCPLLAGVFVVLGKYLTAHYQMGGRLCELSYSYASPLIFLEAFCLTNLWAGVKVRKGRFSGVIDLVAPCTFIVYVVHSNPVWRRLVGWESLFLPLSSRSACVSISLTVVFAALIFSFVVVFDILRRHVQSIFVRWLPWNAWNK